MELKMGFLREKCITSLLDSEIIACCEPFSCGDEDLDDFFHHSTDNYRKQLLGNSWCYLLAENPQVIVCAFTLSNSSIDVRHLPGSRRKKVIAEIPREKHLSSYRQWFQLPFFNRTTGKRIHRNAR